jgi:hypothetical protein
MRKNIRSLILWQFTSLFFLTIVSILRVVLEQFQTVTDARSTSFIVVFGASIIVFTVGGFIAALTIYDPDNNHPASASEASLYFTIVPAVIVVCMRFEVLDNAKFRIFFVLALIAFLAVWLIVAKVGVKVLPALVVSTAIFAGAYYLALRELVSWEQSLTNSIVAILIGAFLNTTLYFFVWTRQIKIVWQPNTD